METSLKRKPPGSYFCHALREIALNDDRITAQRFGSTDVVGVRMAVSDYEYA
jgi:hypothetical protein